MTIQPQYFSPVPMPAVPSSLPDLRPKVFNEEFYNATGSGIAELGKTIGAANATRDSTFSDAMLNALDKVNGYQRYNEELTQQFILDPDSVNVEDVAMAEADAKMSLDITARILSRIVQAWKDIINTR